MRLATLEPVWLKRLTDREWKEVDSLAEADGIFFLCPKCFTTNSGRVGTHAVLCWRPSVPQTTSPVPGRWEFVGTSFEDLTLVAGSSSVQLIGGCEWHGFIRNGEVTNA